MAPAHLPHLVRIIRSFGTTMMRAGMGSLARPALKRPMHLLKIYEFEGCPYCRIVREALTELDLDAAIYPCPKGGERFRPRVLELGGKMQFPYLVDPNTGVALYESEDIVRYLFETYGRRPLPLYWCLPTLQQIGSALAGRLALGAGVRVGGSRLPEAPLELFSFEASPFARLVRERMSELELPYVLRSAGPSRVGEWWPRAVRDAFGWRPAPSTDNRRDLEGRAGETPIPYLIDPNTGIEMAGSARILDYLARTYAL